MVNILKVIFKKDLYIFFLLLLFLPLFFYKLSQSSLTSWDEAWYASIARNIIHNNDFFNLSWNGLPFSDKPPGGIWFQVFFFKILGISEFSTRLPSAIAGVLSLCVVYLLGSKFSKLTGIFSVLALVSSPWFLYRSRLGDLDIILVFFYLLTFYLAILSFEKKKYFLLFSLSFAFLSMIKGIVFIIALLPSLFIIFWGSKMLKKKDFLLPLFLLVVFFGGWILMQYIYSPSLAIYHFVHSFRDSSPNSDILINLKQTKEYLHNGIGKWFWPGVVGVGLSVILNDKRLWSLAAFCIIYLIQFQFSAKIEIWHLIPVYPFLILSFFGSAYVLINRFFKQKFLLNIILIIFTIYISFIQIKRMWYEFIDIPSFVSDDAILSREAGKYPYPFYIDGSFEPVAVFYSGKNTKWENEYSLPLLFGKKQPFLLIVKQFMLDKLKVDKKDYKVLKSDRDKMLILYEPGK